MPIARVIANIIATEYSGVSLAIVDKSNDRIFSGLNSIHESLLKQLGERFNEEVERVMKIPLAEREILPKILELAGVIKVEQSSKLLVIGGTSNFPDLSTVHEDIRAQYLEARRRARAIRDEKRNWLLMFVPFPSEAALVNKPYRQQLTDFFAACDRDWPAIETAQSRLIDILSSNNTLSIVSSDANDRWPTNLIIDITRDPIPNDIIAEPRRNFANSGIHRNMPGSEVFTGPKSVNGILGVNHPLVISNIVLGGLKVEIKDNEVLLDKIEVGLTDQEIASLSPTDAESLITQRRNQIIDIFKVDNGARFIGELGIGTNSKIKGIQPNPIMAEKGGFHLGVGYSYQYKSEPYLNGEWVNVDNGNRSHSHLDISPGGRYTVILTNPVGDETILIADDKFIPVELSDLNV